MLAVLSEHYLLASHEFRCTSSIGIILFSGHNASVDDLLKRVDIAMYQAKHSGRNRLCFFDKIMQSRLETRVKLEQDLRLGMSQNQFLPYYQKQVSHDGSTIGAELLIRWLHPQDGIIAPMQFIPLAEESGMILQMGQYMLEIACKQLEVWKNSPVKKSLSIAVNVSSRQFYQPDFVNTLVALINKYSIDPNKLDLELTETVVLDNIDDAMTKMRALNQLGIKFSIDDFGTGYSSLAYLTQLPLSFLKIDQSFVRNIGVKANDGVIIQTILAMAKSLGMTVIAEGVETQAQRDFLAINGCKLYQGFLFGKPVPLMEFEQSLSTA
jgi:EAL domain-containing protein (putative c-di-GMP-specific phosphodiesterase class I)